MLLPLPYSVETNISVKELKWRKTVKVKKEVRCFSETQCTDKKGRERGRASDDEKLGSSDSEGERDLPAALTRSLEAATARSLNVADGERSLAEEEEEDKRGCFNSCRLKKETQGFHTRQKYQHSIDTPKNNYFTNREYREPEVSHITQELPFRHFLFEFLNQRGPIFNTFRVLTNRDSKEDGRKLIRVTSHHGRHRNSFLLKCEDLKTYARDLLGTDLDRSLLTSSKPRKQRTGGAVVANWKGNQKM
ncbi:hypothetical protein LXL04_024779 [Taraxacum kok-saghyz]